MPGSHVLRWATLVLLMAVMMPLNAATYTWDGGGGDTNWSTATNWSPDVAPTTTNADTIVFSAGTAMTMDAVHTVGGLIFVTSGAFTVNGGSALTIHGSGVIAATNVAVTISCPVVLGAAQTWTNAGSGLTTVSGNTSGAFALIKAGSGVVLLSGTNTNITAVTVNDGTLRLANGAAIPDTCPVTLANTAGVVLDLNNTSETIGSLAGGGTTGGNVTLGTATLTAGGSNATTTYAGVISGTGGSVTKAGTGTWTVSGTNTYTGATTINAGTVVLGSGTVINDGSAVTIASAAAVLNLNNFSETIGSLAGGGGGGNVTLGTGTLTTGGNGTSTAFAGVISGTGGVAKNGVGTWTLTGTNTYTGTTTVNLGVLLLNAGGAAIADTSAVTIANAAATLDLNGTSETIASLTGTGPGGTVALGAGTLTTGGSNATTIYAGIITGTGGLTKAGTGTFTLSGANTYDGATQINASSGTLVVNNATALGSAAGSTTVLAGSTLQLGAFTVTGETLFLNGIGTGATIGALSGSGSGGVWTGTVTLQSNSTIGGAGVANTISGVINDTGGAGSPYSLTKNGAGTWILSGTNATFTTLTLTDGTLRLANNAAIPDTCAVTLANTATAILDLNGTSETIGSLAGGGATGGNVTLGTGTLTTGGNNTSTTYTGVISGVGGSVTKVGTGAWTLSGTNTYTGATTINLGTVTLGIATAINDGSAVTIANGVVAVLNLNNLSETIGSLAGGGGGGNVTLGSGTLTTGGNGTSTAFAGVISGTGGVAKNGAGTWTLTGTNTYTGTTTVNLGVLLLNAGGTAIADGSAVNITNAAATLDLNGISETIASLTGTAGTVALGAGTLTTGGSNATTAYAGIITGTGGLTKAGTGTFTLSGANTYDGATQINASSGTLVVSHATALGSATGSTTVLAGSTLQLGAVTVTGEPLFLNGIGTGAAIGALSATGGGGVWDGTVTLQSNSTIGGAGVANTISGVISDGPGGPFTFTKVGAGTWNLSGANNYGGATIVSTGTLSVQHDSALGTNTFGDGITTFGTTVTSGATLDLTGTRTITGETLAINGIGTSAPVGALSVTGTNCVWTGSVTMVSVAATLGGTGTGTISGVVSDSVSLGLTKNGTGAWTLSNTNTWRGTTTVTLGTLQVATLSGNNATVIPDGSAVTIANAVAVLDLNNNNETIGSLTGVGPGGTVTLGAGTLTTGGNNGTTTFAGIISGTGGLTKAGTGAFTLSGNNTYDGATLVNVGTVIIGHASALGSTTGSTTVATNATLQFGGAFTVAGEALFLNGPGTAAATGALSGTVGGGFWTGTVTLQSNSTIGGAGVANTISGIINDAGGAGSPYSLSKVGAGTWNLSGANTYPGTTIITTGTLSAQHDSALGTTANGTSLNTGATLDLTGTRTITGETLTFAATTNGQTGTFSATGSNCLWTGAVNMTGPLISANTIFSLSGAGSCTISGPIGGNSFFTLNKAGNSTWTLSAANAYVGPTTVTGGTLVVSDALALGTTAAGTTVSTNATLQLSGVAIVGEGLTIVGQGFSSAGALVTSGTSSWSGTVAMTNATTVTIAGTTTFSGVVSGGFTLTKEGAGEARLSATNTFAGLTINAGSVRLSGGTALSDAAVVTLADVAGATLDLAGTNETIGALGGGGTTGGVVTLGTATLTTGTSGSPTFGGVISGTGGFAVTGSGTMTLTATSTYSGATSITGATVVLSGDNAAISSSLSVTLNGAATLSMPGIGSTNPNRILDTATVTMNGATITLAAAPGVNRVEDIGGLLFASGANVITLVPNGANTAILRASGYGHTTGATLTFNPTDSALTKLFFTSASNGEVLGWSTVTHPTTGVGQYSTTNGLMVVGNSKVTAQVGDWATPATWSPSGVPLAGDNVQVLHAVTLTTDQTVLSLEVGTNGSISAPSGRRTLTVTSGGVQISSTTSLTIDANLSAGTADVSIQHVGSGTVTILGAISGGNLNISAGTASVRLEGANTYAGTTTVFSGTLVAANAAALSGTVAGTRVIDGAALVIDGVAIGAEALTIRGTGPGGIGALSGVGTSSLSGTITMDGATGIGSSGTLTLSGVISGAFPMTKVGNGMVVLTSTNTYSGGTTVSAGTLQALRTSIPAPGPVINNATLAISESGTGTFTVGVTGPGDFVKLGAGTLILGPPTLISATTTVAQGTLQLNNLNGAATEARVTGPVINNGTLAFNYVLPTLPTAQAASLFSSVISGSGSLTKFGDGLLELSGLNTFTGDTTISGGILRASNELVSNSPGALGNSATTITIGGAIAGVTSVGAGVLEVNTPNASRPVVIGSFGGRIDAYGSARTVTSPITVSALGTGGGMTSSIVATSLRGVALEDWRTSQAITGTRIDPLVNFSVNAFGTGAERLAYGIVNFSSSDTDWNGFSMQWDGYLRVVTNNTSVSIRADDTVRMWIDLDNDSVQDVNEIVSTTGTTTTTPAVVGASLPIGLYRVRLQFEDGSGGNAAQLLWNDMANSAGTVSSLAVIPTYCFAGFSVGGVTTAGAGGQTLTLTGLISGTGSLSKVGTSTALLNNVGNVYAGGTYVVGGTLRSGASEVIPNNALVVDALATLDLANFNETVGGVSGRGNVSLGSATLTLGSGNGAGAFSGVVSGTGGITKVGTGTQVFSSANSYQGPTQVSLGVLAAGNATALGTTGGATVVDDGGSLEVQGVTIAENLTLNGLGNAGSGALRATGTAVVGGTIDLNSATSVTTTGDLTLAGVVSGTGAWSLSGGIITLPAANIFSGTTSLTNGTLVLGNDLALGTTAGGTVVSSGATLSLVGATVVGEDLSLSGTGVGNAGALINNTNGSGSWSGNILLAANASVGGTGTITTLSGVISGSGGLTKSGNGAYVLSGTNTFTGATTISSGTLTLVGDTGSIAASSAVAIGNGATLAIDPSGVANPDRLGDTIDVTFTGGTLVVQAPASTPFTETVGRLVIASGANLVDLHPTLALATQLFATNGFSQTSPATFTLDRNVAEGTTNLFLTSVANGTVFTWTSVIESSSAIGRYSTADGLIGIVGGFFTIADGAWTAPATWSGGNVPGVGDAVDVRHVVDLTSDEGVVSLGLSNNGQITTGGGPRHTLSIGAGTVTIAAGTTAPAIDANLAFATVDAIIRQDAGVTATILGVISGSGSVTKTGAGTLRLEGANTYTGVTQIGAGTVVLANANALGTTGAGTTVVSGASIDLDGITLASEALALSGTGPTGLGVLTTSNAAGETGTITLSADASIGGSGTLTIGGIVVGSGRLTKVGSGTVVLSAINTYSGGTTISAGTLRGAASAFPGNIINQATLEFAQATTGTYGSIISGTGAVQKTGAGTLILSGASTYTGTTTVLAGTLRVTADVVAGVAGPLGAANTAIDLAGGSFESATTTISRPLQVSAAGVRIDVSGSSRTIASPINASGPQVLTVGNSNGLTATFSGAISDGVGVLSLVKDGSNIVVLTGANTYSGGTTVSEGTLQGTAGGLQGNIANTAALVFDQTTSTTFSGLISGTGTVTKIGSGTVVMGALNTYTGLTSINAGYMRASADVIASTAGPFGSSAAAVVLNGGGIESDTTVFSRAISVAEAGGQLDAYGLDRTVSAPITMNNGGPGMTATIISTSMRAVTQDDWRATQTVIGSRLAPRVYFTSPSSAAANSFGTVTEFATYAISNVTTQWEDFSIQWDGWISVLVPNTVIYTASDDGTRMWVDLNHNDAIDSGEWMSNGWGVGQGVTARAVSPSLPVGLYRVRLQYEQGTGGGEMRLLWTDSTNSDGVNTYGGVNYYIIPNARFAPFNVGGTTVASGTGQMLTLTGVIGGANAGLHKVGTSTVVLNAVNTYGGATLVEAGTLRTGIQGALPPTHVGIPTGGTLDLAGFNQAVGPLSSGSTGGGTLLLGSADLTVTSSTPSLYEGVISGSGGLTKLGTEKLTLSGTNTFTGAVTITAGTLGARSSSAFGTGVSDVTVANGAGVEVVGSTIAGRALIVSGTGVAGAGAIQASGTSAWSGAVNLTGPTTVTSTGALTLSGVISGTGALTSNGAGSVALSGTNTWTGDLTITAGTVAASGGAAISDLATVTLSNVAGAAFTIGTSETIGALVGGGNLGGNVGVGANTLTLGGNNSSTTFAGALSGTGGLVKTGTGAFTLSGTSTLSGPTTLSVGELAINGTTVSNVTAAAGTVLSGAGSLGSGTLAASTLRPGASAGAAGTMNTTALTLAAGAVLDFNLGTTSDRVMVSGNGTLDGTLNVTALAGFGVGTYPLITVSGVVTDQGITISPTNMPGGFTYQLDLTTTPGTVLLVVGAQTIQVAASDAAADEAGLDPGQFTVTRTGTHGNLVVYFTLGGTATSGTDYASPGGSVTILDGATTATVDITPIDDQATVGFATASQTLAGGTTTVTIPVVLSGVEPDPETIVLTLTANSSYALGATTTATVNLADDDQSAGSLDVTVTFDVTGLYTDLGDQVMTASPLVIPAGSPSGDIVIRLAATPWSNRSFTATLSAPVNASLGIATQVVTLQKNTEEESDSKLNQCGLGSGLTVLLLMFGLIALRLRQRWD